MNRIEAFRALFGKSSDLACQEAVDVLKGDLDVRDNEQDELGDVCEKIDLFQSGMTDYIDQLEPDDLRIPFLKQFLPTEKAEDKAPAKALVGVDDLDALLGGVGKREEVPEKKPKKVGAEVNDAQYKPSDLPQLTWQIQELLKTPRFQEDRTKIEEAHSKTLSRDPNVQAQGRRELASWHAYMNSYAQGNSGHDKILHGKHLLECIQLLFGGTNPTNDSGYLTRFVDGRSHP